VLQDKWALELLGMVSEGARIGFWQKEFSFLESHLIGDPTFRFSSPLSEEINSALAKKEKSTKVWEKYLNSSNPNLQSLAVKMLPLFYEGDLPRKLYELFSESSSYSVRMEALQRLYATGGDYMVKTMVLALDDPYELIRRNAARYSGFSGDSKLIPLLVSTILFSNESKRVQYSAQNSLLMFDPRQVLGEIRAQGQKQPDFAGKETSLQMIEDYYKKEFANQQQSLSAITDKKAAFATRVSAVRHLRNYNNHRQVSELIKVLEDNEENKEIRVILAEALGWFRLSINKNEIVTSVERLLKDKNQDKELSDELTQTYLRLTGKIDR